MNERVVTCSIIQVRCPDWVSSLHSLTTCQEEMLLFENLYYAKLISEGITGEGPNQPLLRTWLPWTNRLYTPKSDVFKDGDFPSCLGLTMGMPATRASREGCPSQIFRLFLLLADVWLADINNPSFLTGIWFVWSLEVDTASTRQFEE